MLGFAGLCDVLGADVFSRLCAKLPLTVLENYCEADGWVETGEEIDRRY